MLACEPPLEPSSRADFAESRAFAALRAILAKMVSYWRKRIRTVTARLRAIALVDEQAELLAQSTMLHDHLRILEREHHEARMHIRAGVTELRSLRFRLDSVHLSPSFHVPAGLRTGAS